MLKFLKLAGVSLLKAFAHLPFWIIYRISDFLYFVIYYLVGYRKKIVFSNLKKSFPEKSDIEINKIAKRFYRHFCDMTLESVKLYRMTDKQLDERLIVKGIVDTNKYAKKGQSIILWGMHYNNWEWSASLQRSSLHQLLMIYNPVRNNIEMERHILNMRGKFGGMSVPVHQSARAAIQFDQGKRPGCLWLAADQAAFQTSQFWTIFLNQETPFFSGPEKIAKKTNHPIFFHHTRKLSRGHYEVTMTELISEPAKLSGNEILLKYVDVVEKAIQEAPEYWLWSHRRWKHIRPDETELTPRN